MQWYIHAYVESKLNKGWSSSQSDRSNEKGGIVERRELKKATKTRVYNAMVIYTNRLYGCETCTLMKRYESRLRATEIAYILEMSRRSDKD